MENLQQWKTQLLQKQTSEAIKTNIPWIDQANAIKKGTATEISGEPGSGKTKTVLQIIAQLQANNKTACIYDVDQHIDWIWAKTLGINTNKLIIISQANAEIGLQICIDLTKSGGLDILAIDSITGLGNQDPNQQKEQQAHRQALAKLPTLLKICGEETTALLLINQARENKRSYAEGIIQSLCNKRLKISQQQN